RISTIKCNGGSSGINHINSTSHLSSRVTIGIRDIVSNGVSTNHSRVYCRSINDDATSYVPKTSIVSCCTKFSISVTSFNNLRISTIKRYSWNGRIHNIYSTSNLHSSVTIGIINIVSYRVSTNHSRIHSRSINDYASGDIPKTSIVSCCTKFSISVTSFNGLRVCAIKRYSWNGRIGHIYSTSHLSSRVTI